MPFSIYKPYSTSSQCQITACIRTDSTPPPHGISSSINFFDGQCGCWYCEVVHFIQLNGITESSHQFNSNLGFESTIIMKKGNSSVWCLAKLCCVLCFVWGPCQAQDEGDSCIVMRDQVAGICTIIDYCPSVASLLIYRRIYPTPCGFIGDKQVVCCPITTTERPVERPVGRPVDSRAESPTLTRSVSTTTPAPKVSFTTETSRDSITTTTLAAPTTIPTPVLTRISQKSTYSYCELSKSY